ncbi:MAG: hypothetical protein EOM25_11365 [Deltaproteobacteria bacterium]|nr:hypothetical protein [Deltaproteobacteria bacterium]
MTSVKYLIIGGGPTGLGAGHRLRELGEESFLVLERGDRPGGLSASYLDDQGFTWDVGGHVVFSHYEYFDRLLDDLLGPDRLEHQRVARIRIDGRWVPYPFQNNIRHLSREHIWECVQGLLRERAGELHTFKDWILHVFGPGIARLFMLSYNFKVWATPPELMSFSWIGERVSVVDLKKVLENLILEREDESWGPNNSFRFPLRGGTGDIFVRLAARLGEHLRLNAEVVAVDMSNRTLTLASGEMIGFEALLNTGPLDLLVQKLIQLCTEEHPIVEKERAAVVREAGRRKGVGPVSA